MNRMRHCIAALLTAILFAVLVASCAQNHDPRADLARTAPPADSQPTAPPQLVGPQPGGGVLVPTQQLIRPAGDSVAFEGRPVDLVVSPDGATVFVKDDRGLTVIDAASWKVRQRLKFPSGGGSMHGIAVSRDGSRVYLTNSSDALFEAEIAPGGGSAKWGRKIVLAGRGGTGSSYPCGVCLTPNGRRALVCLSMNNTLAVVDLFAGKREKEIPVGVAPFDAAVTADGRTAYVSNWGGRRPAAAEPTTKSAGTNVLVDPRGIAASGSVSVVDVDAGRATAQVETGLHPSDLALSADERRLYVANANSDTVSVVGVGRGGAKVIETIPVRPDAGLPFGSAPNALAIGPDGQSLYVALGGNNAVAVVALANGANGKSEVKGFVPAGWYPGAVAVNGQTVYVANVKGVGSRAEPANQPVATKGRHVKYMLGTVNRFAAAPSAGELEGYTRQVRSDARIPEALRAWEKADRAKQGGPPPVPVPARFGEPSVFDHVVYVIKENRTYDQVLGDVKSGNGDPRLCIFGRNITPNHHALAEQFVLLDNFYCNGVVSADGHAWATEGFVTDYFEKAFGGFTRVYFSGDALTFSPTGFIWDNVLTHGLSFRNYGEKDFPTTVPPAATFRDIYSDFVKGTGKVRIVNKFSLDPLKPYSAPGYAGWNLKIPDVVRADVFLKELAQYESGAAGGGWPNFLSVYLPNDHTNGTSPNHATPRAMVADNDLALGRIVEAISHSKYWPTTCIFVIEDDPQAGFDHVDGHRSVCLVISPYTKRGQTVSTFYNQTAVLHTMEQMLALPPMNQMDAMAPLMTGCFQEKPDLTPYAAKPNQVPLDEMNKRVAELRGEDRRWAEASLAQDLDEPDRADDDTLNRVLWHAARGDDDPYPASLAGAHGKGLKAAGLKLDRSGVAGRDDDDD